MSIVPISLPYGFVAVYGSGTDFGSINPTLSTTDTINKFGTIYFVGVNMGESQIGESIIFNSKDQICQLAWDRYPYTVIPANKIIGTEINLPET